MTKSDIHRHRRTGSLGASSTRQMRLGKERASIFAYFRTLTKVESAKSLTSAPYDAPLCRERLAKEASLGL